MLTHQADAVKTMKPLFPLNIFRERYEVFYDDIPTGSESYTREQASQLTRLLTDEHGQEVELFVLTLLEVVAAPDVLMAIDEMNRHYAGKQKKLLGNEVKRLLASAVH
jgi:hypothetical protein